MSQTAARTELAQRQNDGIQVTLLWSRADGSVVVSVRHLDAYYHPFSYTPRRSSLAVKAAA